MSENFKLKNSIMNDLELAKILVGEREVSRMSGASALMLDENTPSIQKGVDTQVYKALSNFMDGRLYGMEEIPAEIAGKNVNKPAKQFMKYTSMVMIGLNGLSSTANVTFGQTVRLIESVGSLYFKKGDLKKAYSKYTADIHNIMGDVGQYQKKSKTNLLLEQLSVLNDYTAPREEWVRNNRFKRSMSSNSLFFMQNSGEHFNQAVTMYAVMNNIKARDKDGNYLTKNGTTTDRSKAAGLDELYKKSKSGNKMVMDERVAFTDMGKWTPSSEYELSLKIREINYELDGAYSRQNRAELQRTIVGKMLFQMRGFLIPGFHTRFRGITSFTSENYDRFYSEHLQQYKEGRYVTFVRYITGLKRDAQGLKFELLSRSWDDLDDVEKANIRKTIFELGTMALVYMLGKGLSSLADDDDDQATYLAAFFSNRLFMELAAYINPVETLNVIKSPAATVSMVERIIRFADQLGHDVLHFDMEEYSTGKRAGETKIGKRTTDLLPFWSSFERVKNIEETLKWIENN
tara:strand:- start:336 stop:1889 length:1554 start_codon:yes stop_codon:yes gene_type:complete